MAEVFPGALQDLLNEAGFSLQIGDTTISSTVDVGLPKVRQRYTQSIDMIRSSIDMNLDDWATLETFYKTTLGGGVKTFNYDHPFTGVESEFQFTKPPSLTPIGGKWFRVAMEWREVP